MINIDFTLSVLVLFILIIAPVIHECIDFLIQQMRQCIKSIIQYIKGIYHV